MLFFKGMMVFQGLDMVLKKESKKMNVIGAILDSCPGWEKQ